MSFVHKQSHKCRNSIEENNGDVNNILYLIIDSENSDSLCAGTYE